MMLVVNLIIMLYLRRELNRVRDYLLSLGLPESRLLITWYCLKNPAAPNDTEAGKIANRRVVVKILKQGNFTWLIYP